MANPPLSLFSSTVDPAGVLALLREAGEVTLEGTDDSWSSATVRWKSGWFSWSELTVNHQVDYYAGADWPKQVRGMGNYFAQLGAGPDVLWLIRSLGFSLAFVDAPVPTDSSDPAQALLQRIAAHLDAVFFVPGHLLDAQGRVLVGPEGQRDPAARLPATPPMPEVDEDEDVEPPDAARVARRAMVLGALTMRSLAEIDPEPDRMEGLRRGCRAWLADVGADVELEPHEARFLESPDVPDQQALLNGVWRIEGLSVLCWALGLVETNPYDQLVDPGTLWAALEVLQDPVKGRALIEGATLRSPEELEAMGVHLLAFHWRTTDYRVRPQAMDFVAFSQNCWFGSFPLDDFTIVDNDLALEGVAIHEAGPQAVGKATSAALERHLAINWLRGDARIYSETDTST